MPKQRSTIKREALDKTPNFNGVGRARLMDFAEHVVQPDYRRPGFAPSLCPSRAGTVNFPLVIDVGSSSSVSDFAIIVEPSISRPVRVSHLTDIVESNDGVNGFADKVMGSYLCDMNATRGCSVESVMVGGRPAMPFSSAAGCTMNVYSSFLDCDFAAAGVEFYTYDGSSWTGHGSTTQVVGGGQNINTGFAYTAAMTHYAFEVIPYGDTASGSLSAHARMAYSLNITAGTATCQAGVYDESVFDIFYPEWSKILDVADKVSIPFMDCLVTYQGSTLNNQGSIAVCSASEELIPTTNYYSAIASRPFDRYEGRLASEGETPGGAHWHLLHDDIRAYSLTNSENIVTGPRGYFGIQGRAANQPVRVHVNITLNYYTLDPAFNMTFQPPWDNTSDLLWLLRTEVPLVSSNDDHMGKLLKLARKKVDQALKWVINNPQKAAALAATGAQVVGPMLV